MTKLSGTTAWPTSAVRCPHNRTCSTLSDCWPSPRRLRRYPGDPLPRPRASPVTRPVTTMWVANQKDLFQTFSWCVWYGWPLQEMTPVLRNELVFDRHSTLSQRSALDSLKREAIELELQIRQLQVSPETWDIVFQLRSKCYITHIKVIENISSITPFKLL